MPPGHLVPPQQNSDLGANEDDRWHDLVFQVGAEIAVPLTAALERIHQLTATGKIDRAGLRDLRDDVEQARQVGMIGQQLTRFASGRVKQSPEALKLEDVLKSMLAHRARETQARGIELKPQLKPATVVVDASLLFSLLNTMLDWALSNAADRIDFTIDFHLWPERARLHCRFAHRPTGQREDPLSPLLPPRLDSLAWRLIEQTAWTMGLTVVRQDAGGITALTLEFPRTVSDHSNDAMSVAEIDDPESTSGNSKALAGSHVLVVASRREMRMLIRDSLRDMNLLVDMVRSIDEAAIFCREGLPHAIIIESIQRGARFTAFRQEILNEVPDFVFIEVIEQGSAFEMAGSNGATMARIGRDVVASSLPAALMFELSRGI